LHAFHHPEQQPVSHGLQQQSNYPIYYSIRHLTRFRYTVPISESMMEVRMRPRSEYIQRCLEFALQTEPRAFPHSYRDYLGNTVHHFNIPGRHTQLTITAEALIEMNRADDIPEALTPAAWAQIDEWYNSGEYIDMLLPSTFAHSKELLHILMKDLDIQRCDDPLTTLRVINSLIYDAFDYVPHSTRVDSPIDDALRVRRGVCQDFAHIMIALVREIGIPCRYVSGYLFHRAEDHDRSEEDATHAWLEALLPDLGWIGFDPTNNLIAGDRHIRTAVGRDYADVPPTRGVFKGDAGSELDVGVRVAPAAAPEPVIDDTELLPAIHWEPPDPEQDEQQAQQQQQQQQ
jgi:transglutaminase-like putative cysteine protease